MLPRSLSLQPHLWRLPLNHALHSNSLLQLSTIARFNSTKSTTTNESSFQQQEQNKPPSFTLNITSDIDSNKNRNSSTSNPGIPSNVASPNSSPSTSSTTSTVIPKNEVVRKYVLHCLFTKNNTHFTYCAITEDLNYLKHPQNAALPYNDQLLYYMKLPSRVLFSLSTGCLGFRKSARGEYEAGFQTASRVFELIKERRLMDKDIEIVMKDFGKGRNAFIAALNGKEGTGIRRAVKKISDATSLKFGGVRSPRPRRL